ncbi:MULTISPECIES: NACHT domain-containing protein [Pseudanabaena]|uniref:NACHT domain-containing protein n=1 Tax=Pseudanabaena TaxID=1152 RepID=UPI0024797166|nr:MULTISPECIES: NACHT domain-containing NTPase [Pseudanabaena]MEA5485944.1 NACHT domain-containing NTPase [Pseudanabaena sp. CCNP1317]WGS71362.1 NACHT domain-containing NTPase [Pseudanabaena galeata CCNP1313]
MSRSLRASDEGIKQIRKAMKQGGWTQTALVDSLKAFKRSVITNLLGGKPIDRTNFEELCRFLELDWRDIRGDDVVTDDLASIVKHVRQKIADVLIERCGTMRVLDMTQSVDLDQIYTDVNILEKVSSKNRVKPNEVLPNNKEDFDRWMMGKIKERIAGLEAVETHRKLMVLGKPGSGKTTFLKYLAISCLNGKFHSELVPIFITLKTYSKTKGSPSLEEYILDELHHLKVTKEEAELLLDNGKALILLDGLDEVKDEHDDRVRQDIETFSIRRLKNRFAITCRIAAEGEAFKRFTDVEVADFDDKQIEIFINKWFAGKDQTNVKILLEKLNNNQSVKELAKMPLLLTLICFLFENCNDLPAKRSDLYKEGLEVLMKKWGAKRKVERDHIYQNLSLQSKQDMLGQIALRGFENDEYVFQKEDLQRQIECICNLSNSDDSEDMLKTIEYHHGLLVERAKNIYSFSHLTFQEYFTAREIERERHFETLMQNISNPRWKEVFYLTAEMLRRSDDSDIFVKIMKQCIDNTLIYDGNLQAFLTWVEQKTNSVQCKYNNVAVRAFYSSVAFRVIRRSTQKTSLIALMFGLDNSSSKGNLDNSLELDYALAHVLNLSQFPDYIEYRSDDFSLTKTIDYAYELSDHVLQQVLKNDSPHPDEDFRQFCNWWKTNYEQWTKELRQVCIDHRNIGHDWQFTKEQIKLLNQYYEANLLLVECMNRSNISEQIREEIESTLLLPISSIPNAEL